MNVGESLPSITVLALSILIGYLLGALPFADLISRRYGVDIFSVGTGLAGTSNVRRSVGRKPAIAVMLGDIGKGALAVVVSRYLGVTGVWALLPAIAAILGHWKSVFSGFRGGDGNAILGGILIALFAWFGVMAVLIAILVSAGGQRLPYSSLLNIIAGYLTIAALTISFNSDLPLALGAGGLCALVLARAIYGHIKRRPAGNWEEEFEESDGTPEPPPLNP